MSPVCNLYLAPSSATFQSTAHSARLVTLFANVANNQQPHGKEKQLVSSYLEPCFGPYWAGVEKLRSLQQFFLLNKRRWKKIITNSTIRREKQRLTSIFGRCKKWMCVNASVVSKTAPQFRETFQMIACIMSRKNVVNQPNDDENELPYRRTSRR